MSETNVNFDSCKRLVPSRLLELHELQFPLVSRIEFIRSKFSIFSVHVSGATVFGQLPSELCRYWLSTAETRTRRFYLEMAQTTGAVQPAHFNVNFFNKYSQNLMAQLCLSML